MQVSEISWLLHSWLANLFELAELLDRPNHGRFLFGVV